MADVSPEFQAWVQKAREVDIVETARSIGAQLKRQGAEWAGPCPACGGTDRFSISPKDRIFNCGHQGGPGGDVIAMVMHARGWSFVQACEELTGEPPPRGESAERDPELDRERREERRDRDLAREAAEAAKRERKLSEAEAFWETRQPFAGSPADAYMRRRRLVLTPAQAADLGFVPAHTYWGYPDSDAEELVDFGAFPVMVAAVRDVDHRIIAVHRTYLDRDDPIKLRPPGDAKRNKAKKGMGPTLGGAIWLGPLGPSIALGEGIETTLSWYNLGVGPEDITPVAGVSLGNMAGSATGTIPHPKFTRRTIPNGEPDPERPGLLLPPIVRHVVLLGDGDSDGPWTRAQLITAGRRIRGFGAEVQVTWAPKAHDFADLHMKLEAA